jgi:hypothetical protein
VGEHFGIDCYFFGRSTLVATKKIIIVSTTLLPPHEESMRSIGALVQDLFIPTTTGHGCPGALKRNLNEDKYKCDRIKPQEAVLALVCAAVAIAPGD